MIFGSAILEVIIGLAFVYLLFSLICSALNEWIAGIFMLRAKTLREGIGSLLEDPNFQNLAGDFFAHPLVQGLTRKDKDRSPSYISADIFVDTLLDIVSPTDIDSKPTVEVYQNVLDQISSLSQTNSAFGRTLKSLIASAGITPLRLEETVKTLQGLSKRRSELQALIEKGDTQLDQIELVGNVLDRLAEVEGSIQRIEGEVLESVEQARENIKHYFDDAMDRVTGWYKRRAQVIIVILAAMLALLMNVDSINIANSLVTTPTLREAIVVSAEQYVQQEDIGSSEDVLATIEELRTEIDTLGIPIGWKGLPTSLGGWVYKVIGLLITTIAVSQGAPFWFDVLNKLINIRMTGKKPEVAQAEAQTSSHDTASG